MLNLKTIKPWSLTRVSSGNDVLQLINDQRELILVELPGRIPNLPIRITVAPIRIINLSKEPFDFLQRIRKIGSKP